MDYMELAVQIATVSGVPCAVGALFYAGWQLRQSAAISRGQFMLELERMIAVHDITHMKLRPGGAWAIDDDDENEVPEADENDDAASDTEPVTADEWNAVDDYMGFFEHCELLIRSRSLKFREFEQLFGFRVHNIMNNTSIVDGKLLDEAEDWVLFLSLLDRMEIQRPIKETG